MFGEDKESEEIFLEKSETHTNKFERNHMDRFKIESYDLGDLNAIRVRHDNSGVFPGWFLERVEITTENDKKYIFECNKWFSYNIDDGKIDRVIREIVRNKFKYLKKCIISILKIFTPKIRTFIKDIGLLLKGDTAKNIKRKRSL